MTALKMAFAYLDAFRFAYRNARMGQDTDPWYREFIRTLAIHKRLKEIA